jgi:alpha-L-fucosidase 2
VTTYADHLRLVVAVVTAGELNLTTVDRGATAQALRAANNKTLIQVAGTPWGALCRDHWDFWTDFWAKSAIAIPDNLLENLYYLELYKLACNSRPGKHPCALQGVWTNDCSAGMPPWSGDYHLDMNLQETYWPIYATNHLELGDPLFAWIRRLEPVFERACRDFFGTPGWFMRCTYTLGGTNVGGYYTTESWAGAGAWVAHLLWCRWAFTRDPSHLREALRAVRATLGAYLGMLQEEGGEYVIPLSTSPEYHENQPQAWGKNPTVDLALVRWLCGALEEGALLLGETDELVEKAQDVGERLMYYPADMAGLQVFEGEPLQFSHRHFSHLMAIYPLETLGRTGDPDDRFLVDASLRTLMGVGDHKWSGWSYGWAALLLLRGERPHDAYRMLREYFAFISPNTFHVNNRWIHDVPWDPRSNPMTLEAGFCVAAAVVDMLLRSDRGVIRVFPGVPGWATAAFTRLRAVGAFIVSAELVDGNVAWVEVEAEAGGLCRFANTFGTPVELSLVPPGGVSTQVGVFTQVTPVIEFPTQAGDRYWLVSTVYGSRRVGTGGVPKLFGRPNLFGQKRGRILPYG